MLRAKVINFVSCKEHIMVYDKQLKDFKTMYDEEQFFSLGRADEDPDPHENLMNQSAFSDIK
jgi:hypothetical protein